MNKLIIKSASMAKSAGACAVRNLKVAAKNPRFMAVFACLFVCALSTFADTQTQANYESGTQALSNVTTEIKKYLPYVQNICYTIAGIVAVLGAISVYIKMNNEEQDVKKSIMMIVGACLFLIAAAQALPLFFGY